MRATILNLCCCTYRKGPFSCNYCSASKNYQMSVKSKIFRKFIKRQERRRFFIQNGVSVFFFDRGIKHLVIVGGS